VQQIIQADRREVGVTVQLRGTGAILRRGQVEREVGLKRSTIYQRMQEGTFPRPIRLGERAVGWRASDIELFLQNPAGYRVPSSDEEARDA
jgi:prophage regulatory protein